MNKFLDSLKGLGPMRLAGIGGVGVLILAIITMVAIRSASQPMALLYGSLDLQDSSQVVAALDKQHVSYELKNGGTQILVPADQVDKLRLAMARDNLPAGGSVGYEIFDRGDNLTSNEFQQQVNQLRALEGELERTIRTIRGVRNVRVHLVMSKREPFARDQQEAQASIVLAMAGASRMGNGEVQAIVNLVATAVPGLKPQNISVVDNRGEVLARPGRGNGPDATASNNAELRRNMEQKLNMAVEDMLGRTLGPGHVRAEATVEMNYDRVNETQEKFDPDQQVPRTQTTTTDASKNTEAQQTVSVANNLPNPDAQAGNSNGSTTNHSEETTTYEIGKTVHTLVRDTPTIKRVSMAVLVDGTTTPDASGKPVWRALSQTDLDRLTMLVKTAVGFDDKRGDKVEVVNMQFNRPDELADSPASAGGWLNLTKADILWLVTIGLIALVAIFALGFVVRPMALKLASAALPKPEEPGLPALAGTNGQALLADGTAGNALLPVPTGDSGDKDTMLNVANVQGEVRLSSIRALSDLVTSQPAASAAVVRGWLAQGAG